MVLCLSALLRGRALDVYSVMSKDDVNDYEKLKTALLKRYQLTADGFRKRFRTSRPEPGESPSQFITRIGNYLQRWIDLAKAAETYDGVKKLFIEEQYLRTCPKEIATHLKVGKPETLQDVAERAETYLEAHSSDILFGVDPKFSKIRGSLQPRDATTVDLRITSGNSVPSLSSHYLLRTKEHHSLRSDHVVRSRAASVFHLQEDWAHCSRLPIEVHRCHGISWLLQDFPTAELYPAAELPAVHRD